jgi:hypothetical protein
VSVISVASARVRELHSPPGVAYPPGNQRGAEVRRISAATVSVVEFGATKFGASELRSSEPCWSLPEPATVPHHAVSPPFQPSGRLDSGAARGKNAAWRSSDAGNASSKHVPLRAEGCSEGQQIVHSLQLATSQGAGSGRQDKVGRTRGS